MDREPHSRSQELLQAAQGVAILKEHQELTPEATRWPVERGFERDFGARPLKRLFQKEVQDRLAVLLLEGGLKPGVPVFVEASPQGIQLSPAK